MALELVKSNVIPLRFNYVYPNGNVFYKNNFKGYDYPQNVVAIDFYINDLDRYTSCIRGIDFCFRISKMNYSKIIGDVYIDYSLLTDRTNKIAEKLLSLLKRDNYEEHMFMHDYILDVIFNNKSYHFVK